MFTRIANVGTIDYASAQKKSIDIPRDGVAVQYNLRAQYTVTNGGSAAVGPQFETLARIFRRVDVVLGGRDTVVSLSGESLSARAVVEFGAVPDGMADTVVLTGSAATTYDVTIPIPRFLPRSRTPLMCADDLRRVTQATLEVTWGNSDCTAFYNTPNSAAISAVTCWLEVHYLVDMPDPADAAFLIRQLSEISHGYSAANTAEAVTIDGQTGLGIRSIAVAAMDDTVGSNSLVNAMKLQAGTLVFQDRKGPAIQGANKLTGEMASLITGFYFMPTTTLGDDRLALDTSPQSIPADLKALFDLSVGSGTESLLLSVEAIRPPRLR